MLALNAWMTSQSSELAVPTFIKKLRKRKGLTQDELAAAAGISTATVSNLETGRNGFSDKTLAQIANALECRPVDLLLDPDAKESAIRGSAAISEMLHRIEGLSAQDVTVALGVIDYALRANARG